MRAHFTCEETEGRKERRLILGDRQANWNWNKLASRVCNLCSHMGPGAQEGPSSHHFEIFNNFTSEVEFYKWSLIGQWHMFQELGTPSSCALSFPNASLTAWMTSWPPVP